MKLLPRFIAIVLFVAALFFLQGDTSHAVSPPSKIGQSIREGGCVLTPEDVKRKKEEIEGQVKKIPETIIREILGKFGIGKSKAQKK
jgi:hypothetical protein